MEIPDKDAFYKLYHGMRLGNRLRTFDNYAALRDSGYRGNVSMRYKDIAADEFKAYQVPTAAVPLRMGEFATKGANPDKFTFNESAPDDELIMQGELCHTVGGLQVSYCCDPVNMREALLRCVHVDGLFARELLRLHMCNRSYEMIWELLDLYPDSAIEFGVYSRYLGVLPRHNTVIWEVRNY